jgi:twitching motility protein PilT
MGAQVVDGLLGSLMRSGARGLRLTAGSPARVLDAAGAAQTMTGEALTRQEILQMIAPIVPEQARRRLPQENSVDFDYSTADGNGYTVTILRNGAELAVTFVPRTPDGAEAAAPAMPAIRAMAPAVPAPSTPAAVSPAPARTAALSSHGVGTSSIDRLFHLMVNAKASDLHISSGMPPLVRKDGRMQPLEPEAGALGPADVEALLEPIMPSKNREEFSRRHDTDFAYEISGLARFRANVFLDRKGRGAVFRVIPEEILTAEQLGLSPHILQLCNLTKGLVLVTGPTGSGKSTTLCAMIDYINRHRSDHIITIEDPIEFVHDNKGCLINQREVGTHTDGFKDALRAAMREDPDIVLVGELRDLETVAIAIETAETGHLVFGTLHTTTAASTVDRIIDQFPTDQQSQIRVMLSESLKGVIAQNLCRKIGGGRIAALEVLLINSAISNLIREAKTFQIPSMMQVGRAQGMVSLNEALMDLVTKKLVEPQEAYLKSVDKAGFEGLLKRAGIDTRFAQATV